MAKKKEPAKVWIEDNLIKILPFGNDDIYFLDYSDEMFSKVHNIRWTDWGNGYLMGWVNKKNILLHHLILPSKDNKVVDHINRNKRDNREDNLRYINRYQSGINRNKLANNTSGYTGVYWFERDQKWMTLLSVNGKRKFLGYYETPEEASAARQRALDEYHPDILNV